MSLNMKISVQRYMISWLKKIGTALNKVCGRGRNRARETERGGERDGGFCLNITVKSLDFTNEIPTLPTSCKIFEKYM